MIQSMTGFGKSTREINGKKVTVEVKSVNSKQLDLQSRVPSMLRDCEMDYRAIVQKEMQRGKVEFNITVEDMNVGSDVKINTDVVKSYMSQIKPMMKDLGLTLADVSPANAIIMQTLLRMPDVLSQHAQVEFTDDEKAQVREVVIEAVNALVSFRKQEGKSLYRVFSKKIENIGALLLSVEPYETGRTEKIRQNLLDRLEKLPVDYDKNRLEQEMIYYIEKLDINEEKHRLENHLKYFTETMDSALDAGGHGKKLGFIAQEMGREINTLGSKSNQAEMQRIVVKMKDELEQIKEQVLNVL